MDCRFSQALTIMGLQKFIKKGSAHVAVEATKIQNLYRDMGKSDIVTPGASERVKSLASNSSILWPAPPKRPIPSLHSILPPLKNFRTSVISFPKN